MSKFDHFDLHNSHLSSSLEGSYTLYFLGVGCLTCTPPSNCLLMLDIQHLALVRTDYQF